MDVRDHRAFMKNPLDGADAEFSRISQTGASPSSGSARKPLSYGQGFFAAQYLSRTNLFHMRKEKKGVRGM